MTQLRHEYLLWLLGSLSGLFRLPFDAALIAQNHPPPTTLVTLHETARALGLKTGAGRIQGCDWPTTPLPAIAFLAPMGNVATTTTARATAEPTAAEAPTPVPLSPNLLVARESAAGGKDDPIAGFVTEKKVFGFSWFLPELTKHTGLAGRRLPANG